MHSNRTLILAAATAAALWAVSADAATDTLTLGASSQDFTLTSLGGGYFDIQQGACSLSSGTTTCNLTGSFTSSVTGFTSGTYDFITTYSGSAASSIQGYEADPTGPNEFVYSTLAPSTTMTLDLTTAAGVYVEPLVTSGSFVAGTGFSFAFSSATCTGSPVGGCSQDNVAYTSGSSITGPVTISVSFAAPSGPTIPTPPVTSAVPEPGTAPLMLLAGALIAGAQIRRRAV